ncbi:Hypothetical protein Eab7_0970 [Exiguobacterium antarcticum B7]|nr:Hypothetical protein Eab7_0970 [Exiguobacterium antarcticum B7]
MYGCSGVDLHEPVIFWQNETDLHQESENRHTEKKTKFD